jgi:hypothetical protein
VCDHSKQEDRPVYYRPFRRAGSCGTHTDEALTIEDGAAVVSGVHLLIRHAELVHLPALGRNIHVEQVLVHIDGSTQIPQLHPESQAKHLNVEKDELLPPCTGMGAV